MSIILIFLSVILVVVGCLFSVYSSKSICKNTRISNRNVKISMIAFFGASLFAWLYLFFYL